MPESVIKEELGSLTSVFWESRSCYPAFAIRTPPRSALTTHFIVSVEQGHELLNVRSLSELCDLRVSVESYVSKRQANASASATCGVTVERTPARRLLGSHLSGGCCTRGRILSAVLRGKNTAN